MSVSKTFKVEVLNEATNLQVPMKPIHWDFSNDKEGTRILDIRWRKIPESKATGIYNYYVYMTITCDTEQKCYDEFEGQMSDGYFENFLLDDIGEVWEVA